MFYFRNTVVKLCTVLLALLVGISRIAVGVHWPEDIMVGAALGLLSAAAGVFIVSELGLKSKKSVQLIIAFILISLDLYLLFLYDSKYVQAICLQHIFASVILIAGIREFFLIWKETGS